ncbi:MAG: hypothetical protein U1A78_40420 [Polyangia bacterium]
MRAHPVPVLRGVLCAALLCAGATSALAAPAKAPAKPTVSAEASSRAISELAGKFKWGMTPQEVMDLIEKDIRTRFEPKIRDQPDPAEQDRVRKEMRDAVEQMRNSYVRFNGQKTGWDVSIVDREFGHKNNESMLVMWEQDQRRFLFFWNEKLYKQFVVLNAAKAKGLAFEDFVEVMQNRYGKATMAYRARITGEDEVAVDYFEFPPAGDYQLRAYDFTTFYNNFCLSLLQKSVYPQVEKDRQKNSPPRVRHTNAKVVEQVTTGDSQTDPNADIIDEVVGKRAVPSVEQKRIQERVNREYNQSKAGTPPPPAKK